MSTNLSRTLFLTGAACCLSAACELPFDGGDAPPAIEILSGDGQTAGTGEWLPLPVRVVVRDGGGNRLPDVDVRWLVMAGGGGVSDDWSRTDAHGIAENGWNLGWPAGSTQRLLATAPDGASVLFQARAVVPDAERVRAVSGPMGPDTVGAKLAEPVVVRVVDEEGQPAAGIRVEWSPEPGSGSMMPAESFTNGDGLAAATWTLGYRAGFQTVLAAVGDLPPAGFQVLAHGGATVSVSAWRVSPVTGLAGTRAVFRGDARDAYGNKVTDRIEWTAQDTAMFRLEGVSPTPDSLSEATFRVWRAGETRVIASTPSHADSVAAEAMAFASSAVGDPDLCAIDNGGALFCWPVRGDYWDGGVLYDDLPPAGVLPEQSFATVDAGERHTCALDSNGAAWCWGDNAYGQAGAGELVLDVEDPTQVAGEHVFSAVSAGALHTCGLTAAFEAWCWGNHFIGQLGSGDTSGTCYSTTDPGICASEPVPVEGSHRFTAIQAGYWEHTCGLDEDGAAWCWGANGSGQLGTDTVTELCGHVGYEYACSRTPVAVTGGHRFIALTAGSHHSCGLTAAGEAWCWGENGGGELGNGGTTSSAEPTAVLGGHLFTVIDAGSRVTCGLVPEGRLFCWGGGFGPEPVEAFAGTDPFRLEVGGAYSTSRICLLSQDGTLRCWQL